MKEMTTAERYAAAINAAMSIVNLREEINDQLAIVHNNLTCSELLGGEYNSEATWVCLSRPRIVICDGLALLALLSIVELLLHHRESVG